MEKWVTRTLLSVILIIAATSLVFFAWSDIEILIRDITLDDSYYYFQIAYNIASGKGSSFDGIHETNGYQPLWQFVLVPLWWITSDKELFVHLALSLAALFHVFTGYFLYHIVIRFSNGMIALASAAIWLLSPRLMMMGISGMENSIYAFTLSATLLFYLKFKPFSRQNSLPIYIFGFFTGITFLARVDAFFLFLSVLLWLSFQNRKEPLNIGLMKITKFSMASFVTVLPYLCWNWFGFGLLTPVSGQVKFWLTGITVRGSGGYFSLEAAKISLKSLLWINPITNIFGYLVDLITPFSNKNLSPRSLYLYWLFILMTAIILIIFKKMNIVFSGNRITKRRPLNSFGNFAFFMTFVVIHYIIYSARYVISVNREYYFIPEHLFLAIVAPYSLFFLVNTIFNPLFKRTLWPAGILLTFFLYSLIYQLLGFHTEHYRGENSSTSYTHLNSYYVAKWLQYNTRPDEIAGAWNAGVVGYFSQRQVVNLDGLVNNLQFFDIMRNFKIADYVKSQGIKYLTDYLEINPSQGKEQIIDAFARPRYLDKESLELVFITKPNFGFGWYVFDNQPSKPPESRISKNLRISKKVSAPRSLRDILSWLKNSDSPLVISNDDGIQDWRCYIAKTTDQVEKILFLPQNIDPYKKASLNILMKGAGLLGTGSIHTYDCIVEIDNRVVKIYYDGVPERLAWYKIPIDKSLLKGKDKIFVRLYVAGKPDSKANYVNIFGDVNNNTGKSFFNRNKKDLSPDKGPQKGEYMIRLVLEKS